METLGSIIHKYRNWTADINQRKLKLQKHDHNACKLRGKSWEIKKNMLKVWYNIIIEKKILHGTGIWRGKQTKNK